MRMKNAFTMLEITFVIVIIGILSAIAIPKFAATRDDALVAKGRADVAALRSALATERQKRILKGKFDRVTGDDLVDLIEYPLGDNWSQSGDTFTYTINVGSCTFKIPSNENKLKKDSCTITGMDDL